MIGSGSDDGRISNKSFEKLISKKENCKSEERSISKVDKCKENNVELEKLKKQVEKVETRIKVEKEMKATLKPYYQSRKITKDVYKHILRQCVPKVIY